MLWTEGTRWPAQAPPLKELLTQALVPTLPRAGPEGCRDPLGTHWPRPPGPPHLTNLLALCALPILSRGAPGTSLEICSVPPLPSTCLKGRNHAW